MKYGLIGEHLVHSYSVEIHGLIADYDYELKEIPRDGLDKFMRERDFNAINVTIPYKETVIPYLDEISAKAKSIGAVNTVVNKDGKLYGYNTDFAGMRALVIRAGLDLKGKKVLILGTGGTSKTAGAVAEDLGAACILNVSRNGKDGAITYEQAISEHLDTQIIINATPVGTYPAVEGRPIDIAPFTKLEGLIDVIYNPLRSNLVLDARKAGLKAEGGLYMLAGQGVYASAKFLGKEADIQDVEKAYNGVLRSKENIALIGMPASGKTSVGKYLAEKLGRTFVDIDDEIIKVIGMPISDYFALHGESGFRDVESEVLAEFAAKSGQVIANGGGVILRPENVWAMKRNSRIVFLDRSPEKLITTDDRPLSSNREDLMRRYNERYDIYKASADIIVDGNGTVEEVGELVAESLNK